MASAALIHEVARLRLSDETLRASSEMEGSLLLADWSDEVSDGRKVLRRESATRPARLRVEWRVRNCSTAGWGLSSFAVELSSAYILLNTVSKWTIMYNCIHHTAMDHQYVESNSASRIKMFSKFVWSPMFGMYCSK